MRSVNGGGHPFPKTRNIESSFRYMRLIALVALIGSLVADVAVFVWALRTVVQSGERVYLLADGRAFEAFAGDRKTNLPVEARWHVIDFHHYFFNLEADRDFDANVRQALYLADASAKRVYDNLKEAGYYANVISGNISQWVDVDSVVLDMRRHPFYFRCYATETLVRPTTKVTRSLVTEGWLRSISRSENNPHGFLIERWAILVSRDVKVEQR